MTDDAARIAQLEAENASLRGALSEAQEQQTATAEVLRVIASAPTDLQRVLDAIIETAARLCEAPSGTLMQFRERDGRLSPRALFGAALAQNERDQTDFWNARGVVPTAESGPGRAYVEGRTVRVDDLAEAVQAAFPDSRDIQARLGQRSVVYVPLLRYGQSIGVLSMQRFEVKPFTEQQVALLETFADQAVIAIENARLFEELERRNRELSEALERQTATAEVLRVIASSPTDLHGILDAVIQSAARLCPAAAVGIWQVVGNEIEMVGLLHNRDTGVWVGQRVPLTGETINSRAIRDGRTIHVRDVEAARADFPNRLTRAPGSFMARTLIAIPLRSQDAIIGSLAVVRDRVQPFSEPETPSWRRSRIRPSSPSRTPGSSTSWSGATPHSRRATVRSPKRWSSRPRRPKCCGSSPRRPHSLTPSWRPSRSLPPASARRTTSRSSWCRATPS